MTLRRAAATLLAPVLSMLFFCGSAPRPRVPTPDRLVESLRAMDDLGIEAGIMAQRRGQTDAVRRYGRVLERDRRLSQARVLGLARAQGLRVGPERAAPEDRALLVRLEGVPDGQFDREFLLAMAEAHARAIARLRETRRATPDRRLAALVGRLLPVWEQDRQLAARLGGSYRRAGRRKDF
jgi:putative membrane protein